MHKHSWQLLILQILAHIGLASMLFWASWHYWLVTLGAYFILSCGGASIALHRLLAHKSFDTSKNTRLALVCIANLAGIGSSLSWCAVHRAHHHHSDQNGKDPHSPWHHTWYKVVWLAMFEPVEIRYVKDMLRDPVHLWWHKWYFLTHGIIFCSLFIINWKLALCAWLAPQALVWTIGGLLNLINHKWGYRNHSTLDHSRNNWIFAVLYWGEGWHNNHHANPKRSYFGERWWEFDVSGMIIRMIEKRS